MIRMSALRNLPVIWHEKQIGLLQSVHLDTAQKRVEALGVACGIRGKKLVPADEVKLIADGFILIGNLQKHCAAHSAPSCVWIRDSLGLLTGKVTDYAISKDTLNVLAAEMRLGYSMSERKIRIWVYDYTCSSEHAGELIVPSSLGSGLMTSEGVEKVCAFQL